MPLKILLFIAPSPADQLIIIVLVYCLSRMGNNYGMSEAREHGEKLRASIGQGRMNI
jgi:hypothetical protein